jgi:hypothetical protein
VTLACFGSSVATSLYDRLAIQALVLKLVCSTCSWDVKQEDNDPGGKMLENLKGIHEMTFKGHQCRIEWGNPEREEL